MWQLGRQPSASFEPHILNPWAPACSAAGSVGINLLKFIIALGISGFPCSGPSLIHSIKNIVGRVAAAG